MKYTDMNEHPLEKEILQDVAVGLNIICPECQLEGHVQANYCGKEHFMTAMGTVIHHLNGNFLREMHDMISLNRVNVIRLIMNPDCCILSNAMMVGKKKSNEAETLIGKIYCVHKEELDSLKDTYTTKVELAKLNLILQAAYLKRDPFLDLKISAGLLDLKGVLYHPNNQEFEDVFTTSS